MHRHRIPGILFLTWLTVGGAWPAWGQQAPLPGYNNLTGKGQSRPPALNHYTGGHIQPAQVGMAGGHNSFTGKKGRPPTQANHFTGKEYMPGITALPGPDSPNAPPRANYNQFTAEVADDPAKENDFTGEKPLPFPPAGLATAAEVPNDFTGNHEPVPPAHNSLTGQPMQPLSAGMAGVAMPRARAPRGSSANVNPMTGKARPPAATHNQYTGKPAKSR